MPKPKPTPREPKRRTVQHDPLDRLGEGPLDIVIPGLQQRSEPSADEQPKSKKATYEVPVELIERVRDAAYWDRLTINETAAKALALGLTVMEEGRGSPYESRDR